MKFVILPLDDLGYTAELELSEDAINYKMTGVGINIAEAIDDALLEYSKFKTKIVKLRGM